MYSPCANRDILSVNSLNISTLADILSQREAIFGIGPGFVIYTIEPANEAGEKKYNNKTIGDLNHVTYDLQSQKEPGLVAEHL